MASPGETNHTLVLAKAEKGGEVTCPPIAEVLGGRLVLSREQVPIPLFPYSVQASKCSIIPGKGVFQFNEDVLLCVSPRKVLPLKFEGVCNRFAYSREVEDKPSIEVGEPHEDLNILDTLGQGPG
jgi:hypothetical protein